MTKYSNLPGYLISIATKLIKKAIDEALKPHGVTAAQWGILGRLYEEDGLLIVEIAKRLFTEPPTITRMLDLLEKEGFVTRKTKEGDRRAYEIFLTKKGKDMEEVLRLKVFDTIDNATKGLSEKEITAFKNTLRNIINNLSSI